MKRRDGMAKDHREEKKRGEATGRHYLLSFYQDSNSEQSNTADVFGPLNQPDYL